MTTMTAFSLQDLDKAMDAREAKLNDTHTILDAFFRCIAPGGERGHRFVVETLYNVNCGPQESDSHRILNLRAVDDDQRRVADILCYLYSSGNVELHLTDEHKDQTDAVKFDADSLSVGETVAKVLTSIQQIDGDYFGPRISQLRANGWQAEPKETLQSAWKPLLPAI